MHNWTSISARILCVLITASAGSHAMAQEQGTGMTYQGILRQDNAGYSGTADLEFRVFNAASGGTQVGLTHSQPGMTIADGLVTATLNFDAPPPANSVWNGQQRWLEIRVRTPAGSANPLVTLAPRQAIATVPYAAHALSATLPSTYGNAVVFSNPGNVFAGNGGSLTDINAANLTGNLNQNALTGIFPLTVNLSNPSNTINGTHTGNGAGLTALNAGNIASGNLAVARMPTGGTWPLTNTLNITNQRVNITAEIGVSGLTGGALVVGGDFQGLRMDHNTLQAMTVIQFEGTLVPTNIELNPAGGSVRVGQQPKTVQGLFQVGGTIAADAMNLYGDLDVGDFDDLGELRVNQSTLVALSGPDGNVGAGLFTPVAKFQVFDGDESATQTNFTQAVTDAGVLISTAFTSNTFTPGVFWSTTTNNAAKPKAGIYLRQLAGGTRMHFGTSNNFATGITNDALVIGETGLVGIGTGLSSIDASLHVTSDNARVLKVDRYNSDGELLSWARDDSAMGSVTVTAGTVAYGAFTGVHYAQLSNDNTPVGALVSMTGENCTLGERAEGETVYGVAVTAKANDPAVLGTYIGSLNGADYGHKHELAQIAALGNGDLWIIDTGAAISPGDYLIASDVAGCAMKDDPSRFPIGHIIARAATKVDWANAASDENGVRRVRISVLFGNFVRGVTRTSHPADAELAERVRRIEELLSNR